jgi:hypothetical protein
MNQNIADPHLQELTTILLVGTTKTNKKKRLGWETDGIVALDPRDLGPANDSRAR